VRTTGSAPKRHSARCPGTHVLALALLDPNVILLLLLQLRLALFRLGVLLDVVAVHPVVHPPVELRRGTAADQLRARQPASTAVKAIPQRSHVIVVNIVIVPPGRLAGAVANVFCGASTSNLG